MFDETGCAVYGKSTPICGMEALSDVENIDLLKVHGVTGKSRSTNSDPVSELKGSVLASNCSKV